MATTTKHTRRALLRWTALACGTPVAVTACALAPRPTPAAAPTGVTSASGGTGPRMPTYQPISGATPDLAGTAEGIDPAYFTYPKSLFKSVPEPPGVGGDVMVANSDYQTKLATTMAGSDFPDFLYFPSTLTCRMFRASCKQTTRTSRRI